MENNRFKNIYFYLGLVGVIFSAAGIDFNALTNWNLLFDAFINILSNPVAIGSVIAAVVGVCVDPTTRGLKDNKSNLNE